MHVPSLLPQAATVALVLEEALILGLHLGLELVLSIFIAVRAQDEGGTFAWIFGKRRGR